jgi:hypothetical protein
VGGPAVSVKKEPSQPQNAVRKEAFDVRERLDLMTEEATTELHAKRERRRRVAEKEAVAKIEAKKKNTRETINKGLREILHKQDDCDVLSQRAKSLAKRACARMFDGVSAPSESSFGSSASAMVRRARAKETSAKIKQLICEEVSKEEWERDPTELNAAIRTISEAAAGSSPSASSEDGSSEEGLSSSVRLRIRQVCKRELELIKAGKLSQISAEEKDLLLKFRSYVERTCNHKYSILIPGIITPKGGSGRNMNTIGDLWSGNNRCSCGRVHAQIMKATSESGTCLLSSIARGGLGVPSVQVVIDSFLHFASTDWDATVTAHAQFKLTGTLAPLFGRAPTNAMWYSSERWASWMWDILALNKEDPPTMNPEKSINGTDIWFLWALCQWWGYSNVTPFTLRTHQDGQCLDLDVNPAGTLIGPLTSAEVYYDGAEFHYVAVGPFRAPETPQESVDRLIKSGVAGPKDGLDIYAQRILDDVLENFTPPGAPSDPSWASSGYINSTSYEKLVKEVSASIQSIGPPTGGAAVGGWVDMIGVFANRVLFLRSQVRSQVDINVRLGPAYWADNSLASMRLLCCRSYVHSNKAIRGAILLLSLCGACRLAVMASGQISLTSRFQEAFPLENVPPFLLRPAVLFRGFLRCVESWGGGRWVLSPSGISERPSQMSFRWIMTRRVVLGLVNKISTWLSLPPLVFRPQVEARYIQQSHQEWLVACRPFFGWTAFSSATYTLVRASTDLIAQVVSGRTARQSYRELQALSSAPLAQLYFLQANQGADVSLLLMSGLISGTCLGLLAMSGVNFLNIKNGLRLG